MVRMGCAALTLWAAGFALAAEEPEGLLAGFLDGIKDHLSRLPEYSCSLSMERLHRNGAELPWEKADLQKIEVALVKGREMYAPAGAAKFQDRPLSEMVGRGTVGTGQFALLARHVFAGEGTAFTYEGPHVEDGRALHEYKFDVAPQRSGYRLRSGDAEAVVGFQGTFWVDGESKEIVQLDVQAYDIPEKLGIAEAETTIRYAGISVGGGEFRLPASAALRVVAADGLESLNRIRITGCRQYGAESTIRFAGEARQKEEIAAPERKAPEPPATGALLEVSLLSEFDPAKAAVGDPVPLRVARMVADGREATQPGWIAQARVVRLDKETIPFPMYEIGLEMDAVEAGGRRIDVNATMIDAGPASGLLRQEKRLDPIFEKRRTARMNILVREVQKGQGILLWDARKGALPKGLRMKWRFSEPLAGPGVAEAISK